MDLILKSARLVDADRGTTDIGIENGKVVAIEPELAAQGETIDLGGRLVSSGFVETHIHLDKSGILDRCTSDRGDLEEAIGEVAKAKAAFTPDDVCKRASRTLEKAILQGTTHMRTHLEVDPVIGLRSLEGVLPLFKEDPWAIGPDTRATSLPMDKFEGMAKRLSGAGVALTVLPSTDLFLMGRHHKHDHNSTRGVVPVHKLLPHGVNCSLSSNNVLNPFTPFGDCSLIRMANLYANIAQVGKGADMAACFDMITQRPAQLMRLKDYRLSMGN